jgi:hypothetical protein
MGLNWSRPDPSRLNDTGAIVRKGTYNWQLKVSGDCSTSPCETPWNAENTFNVKELPMVGACGPYGAGAVVTMRQRYSNKRNGGRVADGNGTVPGNRGSLGAAVDHIPEGNGTTRHTIRR